MTGLCPNFFALSPHPRINWHNSIMKMTCKSANELLQQLQKTKRLERESFLWKMKPIRPMCVKLFLFCRFTQFSINMTKKVWDCIRGRYRNAVGRYTYLLCEVLQNGPKIVISYKLSCETAGVPVGLSNRILLYIVGKVAALFPHSGTHINFHGFVDDCHQCSALFGWKNIRPFMTIKTFS